MPRVVSLGILTVLLVPISAPAAGKVTLESLLRQMTDLSLLAEYPDPPYVAKQFSSYDRASEAPGKESWFANGDRGFMLYDAITTQDTPYFKGGPTQMRTPDGTFPNGTKVGMAPTHQPVGEYVWVYATAPDGRSRDGKIPQGYVKKSSLRMDPQGHVLADMDGPGCVSRIWSANPDDAGNVRIYLDGAKDPVLEAPLTALLGGKWQIERAGKKWTPFPDPIGCERSRGYNLYFPIAYSRHCKITVDRPDIYYHVDYRTYSKDTEVETFSLEALTQAASRVMELAATIRGRVRRPLVIDKLHQGSWLTLKPGRDEGLTPFDGPGTVRRLTIRFDRSDNALTQELLRTVVLVGRFDNAAEPQIWCPVGDFFASSPGVNPYHSLPFDVTTAADGSWVELESWWPMPFRKSATFGLVYRGKLARVLASLNVTVGKYEWTDRSMHFHARWRTATMNTRPFRDWTYCDVKGKGVFVGDMLTVMNPVSAWWGEGDEKMYVDGERFPSWFGTGTEDYYGYAWSDQWPFQHAYHNQTRCDGSRGWSSVNRFHILDAIPFEKSFRFDMEVWHWTPDVNVNYAATSYWYARPGATDDFRPVDARVLQDLPTPPPPFKIPGMIEGEKLRVLGKSAPFEVGPQEMGPFTTERHRWSGDSHLWALPPRAGEWVDLEVPVPEDGSYRVVVYLTKARDYGIIQFRLNGQPLGRPIDCFHEADVVSTGPLNLGKVQLKKGAATLSITVVGTNPRSVGLRYMWGLDGIVLKKEPLAARRPSR